MPTYSSSRLFRTIPLTLAVLILAAFTPACSLVNPPEAPPAPVFIPRQDTPAPAPSETATSVIEVNEAAAQAPADAATATPEPLPLPETWLWTVNNSDHNLLRVDLQAGQVSGSLPLKGKLGPVTAGEGAVWLAQSLTNGERNLLRIDPVDLSVTASISIRQGEITSLTAGEGAVWAGIRELTGDGSNAGGVLRVDPTTNEVNVYLPRDAVAAELALRDHALWVLEWNDAFSSIDRLDPNSLKVTTLPSVVETAASVQQLKHIAANSAGIWGTSVSEMAPYVYKIDPQTGAVTAAIRLGESAREYPVAVLAEEDAVWVALAGGKLMQLDPASGDVAGQVQIKEGIGQMHMASGSLWVENLTEAELYQVNPLTHQVVSVIPTGTKPVPTPTRTPRPAPGTEVCQGSYPSRLKVGAKAYVTEDPPLPNRLRADANVRADILGEIGPGESMLIIGGPLCIDGWVWWQVRADKDGLEGWTSEGKKGEYWLVPVE